MQSIKPRKQRKMLYNAPLHKKRKWAASHLEEKLLLKYDRRSIPVIKGDTVKVMRGSFKGHEDKVTQVQVKKGYAEVEGLTMIKADGKKIAKPVHPSNLLITKLNLTDKWRRNKLERGLSEETKKEIEKEAEEQLKQRAEEEKKAEEQRKLEELEAEPALEEELPLSEEEETIEAPQKPAQQPPKKQPAKKEPAKTAPTPKTKKPAPKQPKKTTPKKTAPKKTTTKKTQTKPKTAKPQKKKEAQP